MLERLEGADKIRFLNSGTEAVMMAIRAARARTGRPMIAKVEGAYHGMYDHAEVSLDSNPDTWGQTPKSVSYSHGTPEAVLTDTLILPFNDVEGAEAALNGRRQQAADCISFSPPWMAPPKRWAYYGFITCHGGIYGGGAHPCVNHAASRAPLCDS